MTNLRRAIVALLIGIVMLPGLAAAGVTVNDVDITDYQISQRARLMTLEGRGSTSAAREELVNEALMLSEAKRLNIAVSDAQVDDAIQNLARNLKMSVSNLQKLLGDAGVNMETLRARMRASLAWNSVTNVVIRSRVQVSDLSLDEQAAQKLTVSLSFDYVLKEIIFVGGNRSGPANQYRSKFSGCDTAVELSLGYTDAAVIDVGRRHATQLPEAIAKELAGLNIGGITKPRVTEAGVSMLAVCQKEEARDTTFIKDNLMAEVSGDALKKESDKYLKELRDKARIYNN